MPTRHIPVRPNLDFLRNEAKDLLKSIRSNDISALSELQDLHPKPPTPELAKLSDAQLVLARSYGIPSWNRLVLEQHALGQSARRIRSRIALRELD